MNMDAVTSPVFFLKKRITPNLVIHKTIYYLKSWKSQTSKPNKVDQKKLKVICDYKCYQKNISPSSKWEFNELCEQFHQGVLCLQSIYNSPIILVQGWSVALSCQYRGWCRRCLLCDLVFLLFFFLLISWLYVFLMSRVVRGIELLFRLSVPNIFLILIYYPLLKKRLFSFWAYYFHVCSVLVGDAMS